MTMLGSMRVITDLDPQLPLEQNIIQLVPDQELTVPHAEINPERCWCDPAVEYLLDEDKTVACAIVTHAWVH